MTGQRLYYKLQNRASHITHHTSHAQNSPRTAEGYRDAVHQITLAYDCHTTVGFQYLVLLLEYYLVLPLAQTREEMSVVPYSSSTTL
jgi:hypothetical protein